MPTINISSVCTRDHWETFLNQRDEAWFTEPEQWSISFFGEEDASYLVLNEYTSPDSSWEYVFISNDEEGGSSQTRMIFDFLKSLDYSFPRLIEWLHAKQFAQGDFGNRECLENGLAICRDHFGEKPEN